MANNNFDLSNLALQCICPNNELLYDDVGKPSVMVKIPKMTYAELGLGSSADVFPAFIIDGVTKNYIWISKYQNIVVGGRAYSLPAKDPKVDITFDNALAACTAKGAGWHLMTKTEWALLAWWCYKNGTQPYGNNNYGKDSRENAYYAIPMMMDGNNRGRVGTGTGPLTWSHDRTPSGIWDLNGNVWEWVGGVRTVKGEVQILENNNAANKDNSQSASSALWKAIKASDGSLITPDGSGTTSGSVKMDWQSGHLVYSDTITDTSRGGHDCDFSAITCDNTISAAAKARLVAYCMCRQDETKTDFDGDHFWFNNAEAERSFLCGGIWDTGVRSGVFASYGSYARSGSGRGRGFRSAYYE